MKKYLMMAVAGLAIASCSKMDDYATSPAEIVQAKYNQAFLKYVGGKDKIDPNHTWGFGDDVYSNAPAFDFTRAVPTQPNGFSDKSDINEPGIIAKPSIQESDATVVISTSMTGQQNYDNAVVYVKNGATLTLPDWSALQNTKFYLSSGCTLVVQNFYLKGSTEFVNDGGTIQVGTGKNLSLDSFSGTFWNNGTINAKEFTMSNGDGCKIYLGSSSNLNAEKLYLFKNVLFRNEGQIALTNEFNADQYGHKIYNSGTITTPKITLQKETVLWNEGTITASNSKEATASISNDDVQIYNGTSATLKLDAMTLTNNRELVVNEGTLNVKGKITTQNNSEIVNYSTLTAGSYEMMSGSAFYNVSGGEVTINGLSKIANDGSGNNIDNVWVNSGKYTTGSFEATGGCQNPAAFNNCHMTVTGKFFMNHSNFVLDGGAAVECGSFEWQSDNYFHMGGKALLKVTGQLLANNQNTGYGFYGDGADYAVIQAGSIAKGSEGKFRAAYFGNLFIDTNNHFAQGRSSADGTWYTWNDPVKFSFTDNNAEGAQKATNFSIDIPADNAGCTPGYKYTPGNPPSTPQNDPKKIRIIAEDLSADGDTDFDFNDVVLDVDFNTNPATITLTHAGGTLPLTINGHEVHKLFGVWQGDDAIDENTPKQQMVNTKMGPSVAPVDLTHVLNVSISSRSEANTKLKLEVYKNGSWIEMKSDKGEPACKLAVGQDFKVLDERKSIKGAYPNFLDWVENEKFSSQWWQ